MTGSLARIHALLDGLGRRERRMILSRSALGAATAVCLGLSVLAAAVSWGQASPRTGGWWLAVVLLGVTGASVAPLRRWSAAADRRRLAVQVEGVAPELRGELLTALDRAARPMGSPVLLERVAARAGDRLAEVPAERVVPAKPARRSALGALSGLIVLAMAAGLLPVGPVEAVLLLLAPPTVTTTTAPPAPDGPRALVGDITLRYLYPTYTRLEPLDVPNSSGEVRAPPGTRVEVRARTAMVYPSAALEVYDAPPAPVELRDGRDLSAAFVVGGPGVWRFRFGELPSPDYRIVPDPDLAPDVSVDVSRRQVTLASDQALPLRWAAKDDYGIERVVFEVRGGGATREVEVRRPLDAPRQLGEVARVTAADLGLSPGQRVSLRVGAWDNDGFSGSKPGWSAPIDLEIVGPGGSGERAMEVRRELRDALVLVLADFLVEPAPAFARGSEGPGWSAVANARYADLDELVRAAWGGVEGTGVDQRAVSLVNDRRRELLAFARAAAGGPLSAKDREALLGLQADHIRELEGAIVLLDRILRAAAAAKLADLAEQIAKEAGELQEDLPTLSKEQALARLEALGRLLQQLQREAARLGDPTIEEFVNQRAEQLGDLMAEIRKALAEGRMDDARALMERLSQQLDDLATGLDEARKQQGEADDRVQKAMEALDQELEALAQEQEALQREAERAREEHGDDLDQAMKLWAEAERRTEAVVGALGGLGPTLAAEGLPGSLGNALSDGRAEAEGLLDSIRARDLDVATERVVRAMTEVVMLRSTVESAARRVPSMAAPLASARKVVEAQGVELGEVREILEKLAQGRSAGSPELQRDLQQLASRQQQITERAEQAAKQAGELARNLPMQAPGLEQGARQGAEQSARAEEGLRDGDPMTAEGGQQAAADGFRQARDALQQAQQDMQAMQQASRGQGEEPEGEEDGGGKERGPQSAGQGEVVLPAPEEFQTPEAYRNALLEGMSGEVPEEYRSLNRRYYEELVRQ